MAGALRNGDHPQMTDTLAARRRIAGLVRQTPLVASSSLTERLGAPVHLKCEHHQITGAFKLRGATNAVLALPAEERERGVTAASTGNHGRALAHRSEAHTSALQSLMRRSYAVFCSQNKDRTEDSTTTRHSRHTRVHAYTLSNEEH